VLFSLDKKKLQTFMFGCFGETSCRIAFDNKILQFAKCTAV